MKTVLITGANRGLGLELTKKFLEEGWQVIATCRKPGDFPRLAAKADNLRIIKLDLQSQESIESLAESLGNQPLDLLINNAGAYDGISDDRETPTDDIKDISGIFEINSIAPRLIADRLLPNLEAGQEKLIITISSGMGTYAHLGRYDAEHWPYSASKTAVNYAMISFGELHPELKVVLVHPGWMKTEIGGPNASVEPKESAKDIYGLIKNHRKTLKTKKLYRYNGEEMSL